MRVELPTGATLLYADDNLTLIVSRRQIAQANSDPGRAGEVFSAYTNGSTNRNINRVIQTLSQRAMPGNPGYFQPFSKIYVTESGSDRSMVAQLTDAAHLIFKRGMDLRSKSRSERTPTQYNNPARLDIATDNHQGARGVVVLNGTQLVTISGSNCEQCLTWSVANAMTFEMASGTQHNPAIQNMIRTAIRSLAIDVATKNTVVKHYRLTGARSIPRSFDPYCPEHGLAWAAEEPTMFGQRLHDSNGIDHGIFPRPRRVRDELSFFTEALGPLALDDIIDRPIENQSLTYLSMSETRSSTTNCIITNGPNFSAYEYALKEILATNLDASGGSHMHAIGRTPHDATSDLIDRSAAASEQKDAPISVTDGPLTVRITLNGSPAVGVINTSCGQRTVRRALPDLSDTLTAAIFDALRDDITDSITSDQIATDFEYASRRARHIAQTLSNVEAHSNAWQSVYSARHDELCNMATVSSVSEWTGLPAVAVRIPSVVTRGSHEDRFVWRKCYPDPTTHQFKAN